MPVRLFRNLLLLFLFSFTVAKSQTLYWVGGSGNWNDPAHWSSTSGGDPINSIPDQHTNIIIDDRSFHGSLLINLVGSNNKVRSLVSHATMPVYITGSSSTELYVNGDFILENINFTANSTIYFNSSSQSEINFFGQILSNNVVFQGGKWNLKNFSISDNNVVRFLSGDYNLDGTILSAGNLIANAGTVNFHAKKGVLNVKNIFEIGNKTSFDSQKLFLKVKASDPTLFKVKSGVSFGASAKILDPNMVAACGATLTSVYQTCPSGCDGKLILNIDATCAPAPLSLLWNSGSCTSPTLTNVNPGTYTISNVCKCPDPFSVIVFDNALNLIAISNSTFVLAPGNIVFTPTSFLQPSCNAMCNGTINAIFSGGTAPYSITVVSSPTSSATYTNIPAGAIRSYSNLCAGTHTFNVVDAQGCTTVVTAVLAEPAVLVPNGITTSVACNGSCTGVVEVSPTGGNAGGYTVNWSTGPTGTIAAGGTSSVTGLCASSVAITATVTDTKSCTATYSTIIIQPPPLSATTGFTNATCGGTCNATASVNVTGGTPGYTYTWMPAGGSASLATGLCGTVAPTPPNYTVNVTDANGCPLTRTFTITEPLPIALAPTATNVLCNGVCSGSASANASGGNGSYTYTWSPVNQFTATATGLCDGVYTVTVKDASLCTTSATVQITEPPAITLSVGTTSVTCNGLCTGSATAIIGGGTPSYTCVWTPTAVVTPTGSPIASSLCVGTNYSVQVTDANNCKTGASFTITQPPPILLNVTSTSITCSGLCNGSINSAPSGGSPSYNYTLASTTATLTSSPPFSNLCAGNYTLYVSDAQGCTKSQTVNLAQPNTMTLSVTSTSLSCFGQCNASLTGNVLGGSPGYTYIWTTPTGTASGSSLSNQCAGNYSLTVTDANGCNTTSAVTVASVSPITISLTPTSANCSSSNNGSSITSTVSGGTPGYTLSWSPGGASTPSISNIPAGTYTLTVTDSKGCTKTETATIVPTPTISITTTAVPVSCAGMCNGQAFANATGGTGTFTYSWSPAAQTGSATANNLCAGNQVVTVTDSKGCTKTANVTITAPTVLSSAITGMQPSCNVCIGSASVLASGGTTPYTYSWSPSAATGSVATSLCVGVQTVVVTDANGCTSTSTVNVTQSVILNITTNGTTLSCNGGCTGIASANATGGLAPYTYTWTNSVPTVVSNTNTATGLCAGSYTVAVTDNLGCSNSGTISFSNPSAMTVTATQTNVSCNGTCNGVITLTASGGTGSLSYSWLPFGTGGNVTTVNSLCAGNYTATVTDGNGCQVDTIYTITEPTPLTASFTAFPPSTCSGNDGVITTTVSGGTPGAGNTYTYNWTPIAANTASLGNLTAGSYSLTVIDAAGCTATMITSISDPTGPTLSITSTSLACNSLCNGSATVSATGTGPMTYIWSAPIVSTSSVAANVCQGGFAVSVTDQSNLCTTTQTFSIAQPPTFSLNPTPVNPTCGGTACNGVINTAAGGGTPGYTYTWSPGAINTATLTNACAGVYTVNVQDGNNCNFTQTFTLTSPTALSLTVNQTDIKCFSQCNGSITAVVSGGTPPYTPTWTPVGSFPGSPLLTIVNLCQNVYSLTVTDAAGCTITQTVQIVEPPQLTSTLVTQNVTCNSQCNGSATLTAAGGTTTTPYTYSWSGSAATTSTVGGLCAGNYTGTVIDANGCPAATAYTITQPAPMNVTLTPTNPLCESASNGSITSNVTGGSGAYTYSWIPAGGTGPTATGLPANNYSLIVYDANMCMVQGITSLTDPLPLQAGVLFSNASCNAVCNGSATASPINGTAPYTFSWSAGPTNLCPGVYTLTVVDANTCTATQQFTISTPPAMTVNPASSPATCGVLPCNGSITVVPVGGTPGYSYNWTPPVSSGSTAVNLCAGIYTVSVTDGAGCSSTFQLPLSNSNGPSGATITSTNVLCNAQCNGVADITNPVGGTPTYTVDWVTTSTWTPAPTSTTMPQTGLCADTYTAQITDALGCILFTPVTITEPAPLVDNSTASLPLCNGICDGSISIAPTGGTPTYTFAWSTGATNTGTNSSLTNLCTGNYSVTVTDGNLCTYTVGYSMPGSTSITGNTVSINNNCFTGCNGILNVVNLAGGTPGYTFNWSDPLGQSTAQATGLCNGNYFVVITDNVGCFDTLRGTITSPAAITLTSSIAQPSCGLCNGTATVGALGGTAPFTYSWSNGATGVTSNSLCAGLYMVTITDDLGCAQNINVPISNVNGITGELVNKTDETCFGQCNGAATVTAVGGTGAITYSWTSPAVATNTLNNLCGGTYYLQMTDAVGCIRTTSVTINAATDLTITPFITQPSCTVANGAIIITSVTGGTGPTYNYGWTPVAPNSPSLTNIGAGTYTLIVTDAGTGCSKTSEFSISSQNAPTINVSSTNLLCNGVCNGAASFTVSSGTGPYTYSWSTGSAGTGSLSTVNGLCDGAITLTLVSTSDGCVLTQSISITEPDTIVVSLPIINTPDCNGNNNGSITLVPSGGTLPYTYSWQPGAGTTNPLTTLSPGTYTATVTDANGCTAVNNFTLINPPTLTLSLNITNATCNNSTNAAVSTTVSGGLPAYTYTWTGPSAFTSTNSSISNILPGSYTLTMIDFAGCQIDSVLDVASNATVIANAGNDTTFCMNGQLVLSGNGSSGGTDYQWFQLPGVPPIANTLTLVTTPPVGSNTFVLVATNTVSGCSDSDTVVVNSNVPPVVDAGPNYTLTIYTSTVIGGSPTSATGMTYTWSPVFALNDPNISNPTASNTVNVIYTVTVTDINGCTGFDTVRVDVYPDIFIPNGFSPNGDGKNDKWIIDNIEQFTDCTVEVFNRWGESLFYSKGYTTKWDGKYKGKDLPVGTYYYIINLNHEFFPEPYTGPITIFR